MTPLLHGPGCGDRARPDRPGRAGCGCGRRPRSDRPERVGPVALRKLLPTLLAAACLGWSCASAPGTGAPALAGCYQFERNPGARALGLPWGMVLEARPLEAGWPLLQGVPGVRRALTATSATARDDHPFGYWRTAAADTVEVGHPGGGGLFLTLTPTGQNLAGTGRAVGDARAPGEPFGPRPDHPVMARRVVCGAS